MKGITGATPADRGGSGTNLRARGGDLLVARDLTRVVGPKQSALRIVDGASFTVPRLGLFAINGPSGSGKTTLLNLVTGVDRPSSGTCCSMASPSPRAARTSWPAGAVGMSGSSSSSST